MVHSAYFIRGYATHGYASVPVFPASHGCLRVPIPDALSLFNWIRIGTPVDVYPVTAVALRAALRVAREEAEQEPVDEQAEQRRDAAPHPAAVAFAETLANGLSRTSLASSMYSRALLLRRSRSRSPAGVGAVALRVAA